MEACVATAIRSNYSAQPRLLVADTILLLRVLVAGHFVQVVDLVAAAHLSVIVLPSVHG